MNHPTLVQIEAMSVNTANHFARKRYWDEHPLTKDRLDVERFVSALPGKRVLDLGCGHGFYAPDFVNAGLEYVGIDNSPEMIRAARRDHPDFDFQIMSMNRMLFPEECFDGIWSCCSITTTPKAIMKESVEKMRSLLTPKGVMMAVVPYHYEHSFDGMSEHDDVSMWYSVYTSEEFRELFRSCGFQVRGFWEDRVNNAMSLLARK